MDDSTKPLVTLVIPTRERADTLKFTLATAVDQASTNFQIVVSDNFSQDNTKEVVETISDSRITYVNTGRRLSMADNWDFALQYVRGKYVIYIGDDDGLMPDAISTLEDTIERRSSPIYFWEFHQYIWPVAGNLPVVVSITPVRSDREVDLNRLVHFSLRWGGLREHLLPRVYHGAVSTSLLESIRAKTGRVFHSQCPDIFSAYALPAFASKAVIIGRALTVSGYSSKSNSGLNLAKEGAANVQRFEQEYGNYAFHPTLFPKGPYVINCIQDSVLVAMDLFPEYYDEVRFNYEAMWAHMVYAGRYQRRLGAAEKKVSSIFHLIGEGRKVRAYHRFRVTHFLFYSLIGALLQIRASLKRAVWHRHIDEYASDVPNNIVEFVKLAKRHVESARGAIEKIN